MEAVEGARTVRLAGVQMRSVLGHCEENLAKATRYARTAAADGARLIVFPELMPSGYTLSRELWSYVEPGDGPTVEWLRETATILGVYVGTSFPELDDGDRHVYNTFVLVGPDGVGLGRVRKTHAETALFRCTPGTHVIETPFGRIGVGICADNLYADFVRLMRRSHIDLLLMPHHAPAACAVGGPVSQSDIDRQHADLRDLATRYAGVLGVPVLFVDACGPTAGGRGFGIIGSVMNGSRFHFAGLTTIADAHGAVLSRLGVEEEGVAIADVVLGEHVAELHRFEPEGRLAFVKQTPVQRAVFAVDSTMGTAYYAVRRHSVRLPSPGR